MCPRGSPTPTQRRSAARPRSSTCPTPATGRGTTAPTWSPAWPSSWLREGSLGVRLTPREACGRRIRIGRSHAGAPSLTPGAAPPAWPYGRRAAGAALRARLLRLSRRAGDRGRPCRRRGRVRAFARGHPLRAVARHLRRAEHPGVGVEQAGADRHRELAVPQRAVHRDDGLPRLHLPAPQLELLLRAQHVRGRDVDRERRLHAVPRRAAALLPGVGIRRLGLEPHARRPRQRRGQLAGQPVRRDTLDARRVRADDRGAARPAVQAPRDARVLGRVSIARRVRDRLHRQPLPHRRHPRRGDGRLRRVGRRCARPRAPGGLGLPARDGTRRTAEPQTRARRERGERVRTPIGGGARREIMRNRLIESRLTPNAISITGLILNVVAAVLIWQELFIAGGIAFIVGSVCDTMDGRYSRMSGKGTQFGAFLDSTLDRIEEGIVLTAVAAVFAADGNEVAAAATVAAVLASLIVSYPRARAEALGVECKVGIASRPVRVVILSIGILFADLGLLAPSVYVLAALGTVTVLQRIFPPSGRPPACSSSSTSARSCAGAAARPVGARTALTGGRPPRSLGAMT